MDLLSNIVNMKKNTVLVVSLIWVILLVVFYPNDFKYSYCGYDAWGCWKKFNLLRIIFLFGPALFISSLVTYWVSEDIFLKWRRLTVFYVLAYIAIVVLMPWEVGDEIAGFTKGLAGLVLSMVYLVISVSYVLIKFWELKALNRGSSVNPWLKWFLLMLAFVVSIIFSVFLYVFIR